MTTNARELQLYIDNTYDLMRQVAEPTYRALERRINNGTYDPDKAHKAMVNVATAGAKSYAREYCTAGEVWHQMFSVADRRECATMLLSSFNNEIACGNGWLGR